MNAAEKLGARRADANTNDHTPKRVDSIAAFFDLDGTLLLPPSLEKRFFRALRYRRVIGAANYLLWLAESARLLPRGIKQILYANKMYLRGTPAREADAIHHQETLRFYSQALDRLTWHAKCGHAILIVSGALQPLAINAATALEDCLAAAGIQTNIGVYATQLEVRDGKWTGRIVGAAMFGEAKARAVKKIAASRRFDLEECFAYGDSVHDRSMLESVGKPTATNPSNDLARIAARNGWPVLRWNTQRGCTAISRPSTVQEPRSAEPSDERLTALQSKPGNCS